jgi:hypothetical protein
MANTLYPLPEAELEVQQLASDDASEDYADSKTSGVTFHQRELFDFASARARSLQETHKDLTNDYRMFHYVYVARYQKAYYQASAGWEDQLKVFALDQARKMAEDDVAYHLSIKKTYDIERLAKTYAEIPTWYDPELGDLSPELRDQFAREYQRWYSQERGKR